MSRRYGRQRVIEEEDAPIPKLGLNDPSLFNMGFFFGLGFALANMVLGALVAGVVLLLIRG